ncbi:hypothetical protein C8T65DRAFT_300609 [Cerioporus squamosus]|nr:hypothetical protein C8T65DRAFT_300609 [Cerioporus squamosus]
MDPPRSSQDSSTQSAPSERAPRGGHEDSPASGTAAVVHTASFRRPVPLVPIAMPSPATSREALNSSAPQTPPIPPATSSHTVQTSSATHNAVAGPSRLPRTASLIQESDEEDKAGSSGLEGRQPSLHSRSGGNGGSGHYGHGAHSASIRRPDRAASYHGTVRQPDRYPVPPSKTVPATPTGVDPQPGAGTAESSTRRP